MGFVFSFERVKNSPNVCEEEERFMSITCLIKWKVMMEKKKPRKVLSRKKLVLYSLIVRSWQIDDASLHKLTAIKKHSSSFRVFSFRYSSSGSEWSKKIRYAMIYIVINQLILVIEFFLFSARRVVFLFTNWLWKSMPNVFCFTQTTTTSHLNRRKFHLPPVLSLFMLPLLHVTMIQQVIVKTNESLYKRNICFVTFVYLLDVSRTSEK